jgi:hypothetical protein
MIPTVSMRTALSDANLLGGVIAGDSWQAWRILLIATVGEELTDDERLIFQQLTGREREPGAMVEEFVGVIGRRGGKSRAISVLATYVAGLCRHPSLVRGEKGVLLCIAPDQKQADIVLDYVTAYFEDSPILRQLIEARVARSLRLNNNVSIEVRASDFRSLRGPTYICCIADESAFWLTENSVNPDSELLAAIRPGLSTTNGPLFMASSPYARKGELWNAFDKNFGAKGDPAILVAQAASRTMNPSLLRGVVDRAMERDPASANAEYMAQFRADIESFVSIEAVRACLSSNVVERAPKSGVSYLAFVDPSGGQSDSMTLAIAHLETCRETVVLDCLREIRAPFSPEAAVADFAAVLKSYRLTTATGDKYAALWPKEQFSRYGITYKPEAEPKSILYSSLLAAINSKRVDLLDNARLVGQLCGLERRTGRGGRDSIDHAPGAHDDVCNAVAGVVATILGKGIPLNYSAMNGTTDEDDPDGAKAWRAARLANYVNSFNPFFGGGGRWR